MSTIVKTNQSQIAIAKKENALALTSVAALANYTHENVLEEHVEKFNGASKQLAQLLEPTLKEYREAAQSRIEKLKPKEEEMKLLQAKHNEITIKVREQIKQEVEQEIEKIKLERQAATTDNNNDEVHDFYNQKLHDIKTYKPWLVKHDMVMPPHLIGYAEGFIVTAEVKQAMGEDSPRMDKLQKEIDKLKNSIELINKHLKFFGATNWCHYNELSNYFKAEDFNAAELNKTKKWIKKYHTEIAKYLLPIAIYDAQNYESVATILLKELSDITKYGRPDKIAPTKLGSYSLYAIKEAISIYGSPSASPREFPTLSELAYYMDSIHRSATHVMANINFINSLDE
jgi:hypothetical protein